MDRSSLPASDDDYRLLGLDRAARPSPVVVSAVYRTLARERHPDAGGSAEAFCDLRGAYERVLADLEHPTGEPRAPEWEDPPPAGSAGQSTAQAEDPPATEEPDGGRWLWRAGRSLLLKGRWPATELSSVAALLGAAALGVAIRSAVPHAGLAGAVAEIAPGVTVACRVATVRDRLQRRGG